jgi:antitoxin component HigA of HigAB toxin-antitoxin module
MKTLTKTKATASQALPADYGALCRDVWLPRPIRDKLEYQNALAAIEPLWGHEKTMNRDQADWFALVADLVAQYEDSKAKPAPALPLARRLAGLLEAHSMAAADLARLLGLYASMGSKIINGTRQLTAAHVRALSEHFGLSADYFLAD